MRCSPRSSPRSPHAPGGTPPASSRAYAMAYVFLLLAIAAGITLVIAGVAVLNLGGAH